jgi:hypothetical protein
MKGKLELVIINQDKPRVNYTVFYNGHLCKITEIVNDDVTIKDYFSNLDFEIDLEFAKTIHVLFVVKTNRFTTLLTHKDINLLLENIGKGLDISVITTLIDKIVNKHTDYYIEGNLVKIYTKPTIGSTVEITNLHIIDNNSLHQKEDRIFTIKDSYKSKYNKDVYNLTNSKCSITAIRQQFQLLSVIDFKEVFSIR